MGADNQAERVISRIEWTRRVEAQNQRLREGMLIVAFVAFVCGVLVSLLAVTLVGP